VSIPATREQRLMQILLAPMVSEKSTMVADKHNQIVFEVVKNATKPEIKAAVEMMFTSLLVQAQSALAAAARSAPPGARTRSRGYRAAFLQSYASRIGQRLDEINQAVVAESERESTSSILPVLASRDAVVQGTVDELFGALSSHTVRGGYDPAGWASGRFAADTAQLGGGPVEAGGDPVALP